MRLISHRDFRYVLYSGNTSQPAFELLLISFIENIFYSEKGNVDYLIEAHLINMTTFRRPSHLKTFSDSLSYQKQQSARNKKSSGPASPYHCNQHDHANSAIDPNMAQKEKMMPNAPLAMSD